MIELVAGFWVDPWSVVAIKEIDDKSCLLYLTGEGGMDGHVLQYPIDQVVQAVIDAREEDDEVDEPDEPDDAAADEADQQEE